MDMLAVLDAVEHDLSIPIPEKKDIFTGGDETNFRRDGCDIVRALVRDVDLQRNHRVLEIGSGIGRPSIPLARVLDQGSYDGVDIDRRGVDWCQSHITPQFPRFRFHHYDIYNEFYNPGGNGSVKDIALPFADHSFDIVFLASVFTHLNLDDVRAYLLEIRRVLTVGGKLWGTWFIVDDDISDRILDGRSKVPLTWTAGDGVYYANANKGTLSVGFRESLLRSLLGQAGFAIDYVGRGYWCEPRAKINGGGVQDLIVASPVA